MKEKLFITHPTPLLSQKRIIALLTLMLLLSLIFGVTVAAAQDPTTTATAEAQVTPTPFLPDTPFEYATINLPAHFNAAQISTADNTPADNTITNDGATLGRVLFYDKKLSANNTVSCASCHQQAHGFSDPNQLSTGFEGGLTGRNSMGLANARYYDPGHFFWDERADTLEDQVLGPIQDSVEMGMTLEVLLPKLAAESYYPPLFEQAFGSSEVTSDRIAKALAQFVRSMVSYQSKYDDGVASNFSNFTREEDRGRRIFEGQGRCDNCHTTAAFVAEQARNIGLDAVSSDNGLGNVSGNTNDNGKFKVPSLRNVALTAPYMHDGRFATLAEVVEHYNSGVQNHPNLDQNLRRNGQPQRLNLDQAEKDALVAFLNTLSDPVLTHDGRFADPFIIITDRVFLPLVFK